MSKIRFADGTIYDRDWLDNNPGAAQMVLHKHKGTHPLCLCTRQGVPLYIREMSATGKCYLAKMPNTGPQHAISCPSYEPLHGNAERDALESGAIEPQPDGTINFKLHVGFDVHETLTTEETEETAPAPDRPQMVKDAPMRLGLYALMQYLWETAELHHWHPKMRDRRHYKQVHDRIMSAADIINVKGAPLKYRLFMPEPFFREKLDEIGKRRRETISRLSLDVRGKRRRYLVLGEIRQVEIAGDGEHAILRLAQVGKELGIVMKLATWIRLEKRWEILRPNTDDEEGDLGLKVWGLFLIEGGQQDHLQAKATALMQTTAQYIPVFELPEIAVAQGLIENERRFIKMLMLDGRKDLFAPSFLLTDCGQDPVPLHIVRGGVGYPTEGAWYWDVDAQEIRPEFPKAA